MNKQFIFKYDNIKNWDDIQIRLNDEIYPRYKKDGDDFQVEIKPLNIRSKNALKAYWVLIGSIVKWDANNNGYKQKVWDEWFKREAGLTEKIDLIPLWKIKYGNDYDKYGKRYLEKTRSISNKGDVTKEEMERLINCVLKFGAENNVPNCEIRNDELDKLLEFYN